MAEKSDPKPKGGPVSAALVDEATAVVRGTDVVLDTVLVSVGVGMREDGEGVGEVEVGGWAEEEAKSCCCFLREGGIILGGSSLGGSFPRTFSAMRYMASANCSAFSLPVF